MGKKIISFILALVMVLGMTPGSLVHANNIELETTNAERIEVKDLGNGLYLLREPGADYDQPRQAIVKREPKEEELTEEWVSVGMATMLMDALNIEEVTLQVRSRELALEDKPEYNHIFKRNPGPGENKIGEWAKVKVPKREYGRFIYIIFPDGRDSRAVVEAKSIPVGLQVNIDFRGHTGVRTEWYGTSNPPSVKAEYEAVNQEYFEFDLPTVTQNTILRKDTTDWEWKDHTDIKYIRLVPENDITLNEVVTAMELRVLVNRKEQGKLTDASNYYFKMSGNGLHGFKLTMREKYTVDFNAGDGSWKNGEPAQQFSAHGLKLNETFMEGSDTIGPVNVPNDDTELTPPESEPGKPAKKFAGWSTTQNGTAVDMSTYEVEGDVTFYALYAEEEQGRVAVQYVDEKGNAIADKYKIKNEEYPDHAEGNKGQAVEESKIKEPKFIGYKRTADTIADAIKNKIYETEHIQTVEVKYEKLPDIIPEKGGNGQDNPDATPDVKEHYAKVTFQVAAADAAKAKLQLDSADATSPLVYYVNPLEGKTIAQVADVKAVSKDDKLYKVDANDMWTYDPNSITGTDQVISQARDAQDNVIKTEITLTAKVAEKIAAKFKDKLDPQDIKVWVNDTIDWKKGVKLKEANVDLQKILDKTETKVTDQSNRNSDTANLPNGQRGNLKVTFEDGSSLEVKDQILYVAPHKNDNNNNLPEDAVKVEFKIGEGVTGTAKTEYVKPGTDVKADAPAVTLKEGYKDAKWYKDNATTEATDNDYKVTADAVFTAKAEQTDAKKYGSKLKAKDIVKWVGDQVDWTKGVEEIDNVKFKKVEDLSSRGTTRAGVFLGKLKVTFNDDSTAEVDNQRLIVREKKGDKVTPGGNDPGTYPADAIEVKFVAGDGIKSLNPANKVMVLQKDEKLADADYPTVTLKDNFKTKAKNTDYYDVQPNTVLTAKVTTITATAVEKGTGSATVEYHVGTENITDKIADLKIDGQKYPENNKLTGTEDSVIDTTKITQPELLGYKIVNITTEPATDAKYTEAGTAKVIFNYEKLDDIIKPNTPGETIPAGYVAVKFLADAENQNPARGNFETDGDEVVYYVNPKTVTIDMAGQKLSGKDKDNADLNKIFPTLNVTDTKFVANKKNAEDKYDANGIQQWALSENTLTSENKLANTNAGITLTAKYLGKFNVTYIIEVKPAGKELPDALKELTADYNGNKADKTGLEPGAAYTTPTDLDLSNVSEEAKKLIGSEVGKWSTTGKWVKTEDNSGNITFTLTWTFNEKKPEPEKPYDPGHWYEPSPDYLNKTVSRPEPKAEERQLDVFSLYMIGNEDHMFMPNKGITRAEIAQIFARALRYDGYQRKGEYNPYPDVNANAWYYDAVVTTTEAGVFRGTDVGTFEPNREITKAELIATIARFQELANREGNSLNMRLNHWARPEVEAAFQEGWLDIYTNGTVAFDADMVITRAEVATILNRAFGRIADVEYIDKNIESLVRFADVKRDDWFYYDALTAANTYATYGREWVNHSNGMDNEFTHVEAIKWIKDLRNDKEVVETLRRVKFQRNAR